MVASSSLEVKNRERVWKELWKRPRAIPLWDYPSELKFSILARKMETFRDKTCLETGSGSGRISLKFRQHGARPVLLDISREAIKLSKKLFREMDETADFLVGSILTLPFRDASMDLVWNEGVLEHFSAKEQQTAISEGLRVLRNRGKQIIIVPNEKANYVNFFRNLSIKIKTWPYGYEKPLSPEEFMKFSSKPVFVTSSGFLWQFRCVYVPVLQTIASPIFHTIRKMFPYFEKVDQKYPGYFLIATFIK